MPLETVAKLEGEIPASDFEIDPRHINKVGLDGVWLHATVTGGRQWSGGAEYAEHEKDVAAFLTEKTSGPYFVVNGAANTRPTLNFVFLEVADAKGFLEAFPDDHYKMDEAAFARNTKLFQDRAVILDWKPKDQRLMAYMPQA